MEKTCSNLTGEPIVQLATSKGNLQAGIIFSNKDNRFMTQAVANVKEIKQPQDSRTEVKSYATWKQQPQAIS